jgi:hypothetical protein
MGAAINTFLLKIIPIAILLGYIYASAVSLEVLKHPFDVSDSGLYDTIGVDDNGVLGEYKRKMPESIVIGWSAFRIANTLRIFLISRASNLTSIINPIKSSNKFNCLGSIRLASETSSEFLIIICIIKTNIQFNLEAHQPLLK